MATGVYNRAAYLIGNGLALVAADLRVLLVSSTYTFNPTHNVVSDITSELAGTGYARKQLAGKTFVEDDVSNLARLSALPVLWTGANFGTPDSMIVYIEDAAGDTARQLICCLDLLPKVATSGVDYTANINAMGIIILKT